MVKDNEASGKIGKIATRPISWLFVNVALLAAVLLLRFVWAPGPHWWDDTYGLAVNVLAGGLVSFFFYWLVIYFPERRKRRIVKDNLTRMYRSIKKDMLYAVVFASVKGGSVDFRRELTRD